LIGNTSGGSGFATSDLRNVNPLLAPLGNYGGPTQTMALLPGSPAINAGATNSNTPTHDQRGFSRIRLGKIDIGAFESRGFTIAITSGDNQSTAVNTSFSEPLVVTVTSPFGEPVQGGIVTFTAPKLGASAKFPSGNKGTIDATGEASVVAAAKANVGCYTVKASAKGVTTPVDFNLTNTASSIASAEVLGVGIPGGLATIAPVNQPALDTLLATLDPLDSPLLIRFNRRFIGRIGLGSVATSRYTWSEFRSG
jgi:hypothetical protein